MVSVGCGIGEGVYLGGFFHYTTKISSLMPLMPSFFQRMPLREVEFLQLLFMNPSENRDHPHQFSAIGEQRKSRARLFTCDFDKASSIIIIIDY